MDFMLQTQSRPFNVCNCEDVEKDGKDQFSLRDEISSPATPTQDIPEQQRSLEDLDPRIFAPTGDIYRSINALLVYPHQKLEKFALLLPFSKETIVSQ